MSGEQLNFSSRYKLDVKLGSGGMGTVYRAYDSVLRKKVAVKLVSPSQSNNAAVRFQQEAKTAAKLDHTNIIRVLDFGQNDKGECYLIMEYLEGKSLEQIVKSSGPLSVNLALYIFDQICSGMAHAHANGVLHRDVKPSNIMIAENSNHVTIVDFGVAKFLADDMKLTSAGKPLGSPTYMSPEHAKGHDVDVRSDIYSMGCLMYMALLGKPPLSGATHIDTIKHQIEDEAPLLNDNLNPPEFPKELESVVQKALKKNPDDRFQNFEELRRSLTSARRAISAADEKDPSFVSATLPVVKTPKRGFLIPIALGIAVLAFGCIALVSINMVQEPDANKKTTGRKIADYSFKQSRGLLFDGPPWLLGSGNLHRNGVKSLFKQKTETRLILDDRKISDSDLSYAEKLPLIALDLSNTRVTSKRLKSLCTPMLTCLVLNDNPQITDDSIEDIKNLDSLQVLALRGTGVTDRGVAALAELKSLRCLDLENLKGVTPKSLDVLAKLPHLNCLMISGTAIGANDVDKLLAFPSLRFISFANKDATDKTFNTLMQLCPLTINVSNSQITDASLAKLESIPFPVLIDARGCKLITQQQVDTLKERFPMGTRILSDLNPINLNQKGKEKSIRVIHDSLWYEPLIYATERSKGYESLGTGYDAFRKQMYDHADLPCLKKPGVLGTIKDSLLDGLDRHSEYTFNKIKFEKQGN